MLWIAEQTKERAKSRRLSRTAEVATEGEASKDEELRAQGTC